MNPDNPTGSSHSPADYGAGHISSTGEYEFGAAETSRFADLARSMRFVGIFTIIVGVLSLLGAVLGLGNDNGEIIAVLMSALQGALFIAIGVWTTAAASSFSSVAMTEGNDVTHLMHGLDNMRKIYNLQMWLIILGLVILGVLLILLIL